MLLRLLCTDCRAATRIKSDKILCRGGSAAAGIGYEYSYVGKVVVMAPSSVAKTVALLLLCRAVCLTKASQQQGDRLSMFKAHQQLRAYPSALALGRVCGVCTPGTEREKQDISSYDT